MQPNQHRGGADAIICRTDQRIDRISADCVEYGQLGEGLVQVIDKLSKETSPRHNTTLEARRILTKAVKAGGVGKKADRLEGEKPKPMPQFSFGFGMF